MERRPLLGELISGKGREEHVKDKHGDGPRNQWACSGRKQEYSRVSAGSLQRCRPRRLLFCLEEAAWADFSASPLRLGGPDRAGMYLCTTGYDAQQALNEPLLGRALAWLICRGQVSPGTVPEWAVPWDPFLGLTLPGL